MPGLTHRLCAAQSWCGELQGWGPGWLGGAKTHEQNRGGITWWSCPRQLLGALTVLAPLPALALCLCHSSVSLGRAGAGCPPPPPTPLSPACPQPHAHPSRRAPTKNTSVQGMGPAALEQGHSWCPCGSGDLHLPAPAGIFLPFYSFGCLEQLLKPKPIQGN